MPPFVGGDSGPRPGYVRDRKDKAKVRVNLSMCKYSILRDVVYSLGYEVLDEPQADEAMPDWDLCWMDTSVTVDRVNRLKGYQRLNHFPGMLEICRKVSLARNLARMARYLPVQYNFFPQCWSIPSQLEDFVATLRRRQGQRPMTYIVKPSSGAMGKGIHLVQTEADLIQNEMTDSVAQSYVKNPLLIDGYKFDLRIYVLVRSVDPLEMFIYGEGLARLATTPYEPPLPRNIHERNMHLTNYAVNKDSGRFDRNSGVNAGSKRLLTAVLQDLKNRGEDTGKLWEDIQMCIAKTVMSIQPHLAHTYHTAAKQSSKDAAGEGTAGLCFEVLGFDVLLDEDLHPWVLEVNHSPSLMCDSQMDLELKHAVLADTILSLDLNPEDRRQHYAHQKVAQSERLYATSRSAKAGANWQSMRPGSISGRRARLQAAAAALDVGQGGAGKKPGASSHSESILHYRTWGFSAPQPKKEAPLGRYQPLYPHPSATCQAELENVLQVAAQIYPPQGCVCVFCKKQQSMIGNGSVAVEALRAISSRQTPRGERSGGSTRERLASARSRASSMSIPMSEEAGEADELECSNSSGASSSGSVHDDCSGGSAKFALGDIGTRRTPLTPAARAAPSTTRSSSSSRQPSYESISKHFAKYARHRKGGEPGPGVAAPSEARSNSAKAAGAAYMNSRRAFDAPKSSRSAAQLPQKSTGRVDSKVPALNLSEGAIRSAQAGQGGQLMSSSHASKSNVGVAQSCRAAAARDRRSSNPYANQYATLVSEMTAFSHVPSSMYARSEAVDMEGS
eukprot:jgi/Tetstr1/447824/TSEL_035153.t2